MFQAASPLRLWSRVAEVIVVVYETFFCHVLCKLASWHWGGFEAGVYAGLIQCQRVEGGEHADVGQDGGIVAAVAVADRGHVLNQADVEVGTAIADGLGLLGHLLIQQHHGAVLHGVDGVKVAGADAAAAAHAVVGVDLCLAISTILNAIVGAAVAVLSYIFGEHWILFALFLAFNVADWITGWMKARLTHKENSKAGWKGVLKKLAYWIMIAVAFGASAVFVEIGKTLGVDLGITTLLGFFVLASLLVNEIRSICENLVEMGVDVPKILIKGLEVADKAINKDGEDFDEGE